MSQPLIVFCSVQSSSVQSLSRVQLFTTPWTTARQVPLFITNSRSLLKLTFIESVMWSSHLILCRPLLLLPSIFPRIRVFSNESALGIRWPKYWSFTFNISPSNELSAPISFRMDWLDLLAVQGTLKSLLQHYSSKASILLRLAFFFFFFLVLPLYCYQPISLHPHARVLSHVIPWTSACQAPLSMDFSKQEYWSGLPFPSPRLAFFIVQLSHPYMTTGKPMALMRWTFIGKVMSPLFNMLSRLAITFLPRSKHLCVDHNKLWKIL